MGPLKRVDVLDEDMSARPTIDVVKRACIAGFNMKGFDCDILETERGPSIESLNEINKFNGTIFVRFIHKQYTVEDDLCDSDDENEFGERSMALKSKLPSVKRYKSSDTQQYSEPLKSTDVKPQSSFPPSMSVATMLRMGKLIKPAKRHTVQVETIATIAIRFDIHYYFLKFLFLKKKSSIVAQLLERFRFGFQYLYRYLNPSFSQSDVWDLCD